MWNKEIIVIKEGQLLTGRKQLSKETGISESTVERILKMLENEHQIEQQKETKFRVITILNWREHQKGGQQNEQQTDNRRTTDGQQTDTNKNDKKEEKEKNDKNSSSQLSSLREDIENDYSDMEQFLLQAWRDHGRVSLLNQQELIALGKKYTKEKLYEAIKISAGAGKDKWNVRYVKGILDKQQQEGQKTIQSTQPQQDPFITFRCECNEYSSVLRRSEAEKSVGKFINCGHCKKPYSVQSILEKAGAGNEADFIKYEEQI